MPLIGSFSPPGDKSISHRVALLALLAAGQCKVENFSPCDDVHSSLNICRTLGSKITTQQDSMLIEGLSGNVAADPGVLDCGNSGTTMRMLCGILAGLKGSFILDGDAMLRQRPMARVVQPLAVMGADIKCADNKPPIYINGVSPLQPIVYNSPVASAQVKSALLLAALRATSASTISEPWLSRNHTEILLAQCGARLTCQQNTINIEPGSLVMPTHLVIPGDASSAAFFLSAAAFIPGSDVTARSMSLNPTRTAFLSVLKQMGAGVDIHEMPSQHEPYGHVRVFYNGPLKHAHIGKELIPALIDEIPVLALVAANAEGTSIFYGVEELTIKEINRLAAIQRQLRLLGAEVEINGNNLSIVGKGQLPRLALTPNLDSSHDHRMAMTLALGLKALHGVGEIKGGQSVSISYPAFFTELDRLWVQ